MRLETRAIRQDVFLKGLLFFSCSGGIIAGTDILRIHSMGERRGACRILVVKPEGRRLLGRARRGGENNIKMGHGLD